MIARSKSPQDWGKYKEAEFVKMLNAVYNKVVLRKKSIFYFHPVNLESPINLNIEEIT